MIILFVQNFHQLSRTEAYFIKSPMKSVFFGDEGSSGSFNSYESKEISKRGRTHRPPTADYQDSWVG